MPLKRAGYFVGSLLSFGVVIAVIIFVVGNSTLKKPHLNAQSNQKASLFQLQVKKICRMLRKAQFYYQHSQINKAHAVSESAYWDVYDNILEIKYRSYGSPAEIFSVENQFHDYSKLLTVPFSSNNKTKLTQLRKTICGKIKHQADVLDQNS